MEKILPRSGTVVVSVGLRVRGDVKHELKAATFYSKLKIYPTLLCHAVLCLWSFTANN